MDVLPLADVRHTLRRVVLRRRRLLAALAVAVAVFATLEALSPTPRATVPVLVAATDLPAGTVLTEDDVARVRLPTSVVPDGTTDASYAVGRTTASPVRRGEALTDVRLVGEPLMAGYPGLVAVPVRLPDVAAAALLRVGDTIDLLATDPGSGATTTVGQDLPVIALPEAGEPADVSGRGRLIVVGAAPEMSTDVASASVRMYLTAVTSR